MGGVPLPALGGEPSGAAQTGACEPCLAGGSLTCEHRGVWNSSCLHMHEQSIRSGSGQPLLDSHAYRVGNRLSQKCSQSNSMRIRTATFRFARVQGRKSAVTEVQPK